MCLFTAQDESVKLNLRVNVRVAIDIHTQANLALHQAIILKTANTLAI
jgi:hypothetical protein